MLKKGLVAGLANLVVGMALTFGLQTVLPSLAKEYQTALFRPWNDPLMTLFFAYPFILGIVAAYLWGLLQSNFKGDSFKKAFQFAKTYFIIATIPGMFVTYTSFHVSIFMVLSWTVIGFVEVYIAGLVFTKIK